MLTVRKATLEDAAVLSALNVDVQNLHAQSVPHLFKRAASPDFAVQFMGEQLADLVSNHFFIAEQDGEAVGYVLAHLVERPENPFMFAWRRLLIDQISVKAACQRLGAGELLIQAVRRLAEQLGVDTISLECWEFNQPAQAFFRAEGFETFARRMWRVEAAPARN